MNSASDNTFVPLTAATAPSANPRQSFNVTVLPRAETAQPFRSLTQSLRPIPSTHSSNCEPRVTVQRDGDRVSAIQVQCACGQIIELACIYDLAPASATVHTANSASVPETFSGGPDKTSSEPA